MSYLEEKKEFRRRQNKYLSLAFYNPEFILQHNNNSK